MSRLIIALMAAVVATGAFAQATTTGTSTQKAKQSEVQKATEAGTTNSLQQREAQSKQVQKLKGEKGTPKELATTKEKQQAVSSTTAAKAEGVDVGAKADAAGAAAAKAGKNQPKELKTAKEKQQAVDSQTKKSATP